MLPVLEDLSEILEDKETNLEFDRDLARLLTRIANDNGDSPGIIHVTNNIMSMLAIESHVKSTKAKSAKAAKKTAKAKAATNPLILSLMEDDEIEPFEQMLLASSVTDSDVLDAINDISAELPNVNFSPDFAQQLLNLMIRLSKDHMLDNWEFRSWLIVLPILSRINIVLPSIVEMRSINMMMVVRMSLILKKKMSLWKST